MVDFLNMTRTNKMSSNDQMSGLIRLFTELRLDDKVSSDDQPPGLLRLPPELRLQIYDFLWPPLSPAQEFMDEVSSSNFLTKGALLYTCRQLRAETEPIFYSRHAFLGNLSFLDVQPFITWLYDIGSSNVKLMPRVILHWHIPQHYMDNLKILGHELDSATKAHDQALRHYGDSPSVHNVDFARLDPKNVINRVHLQDELLKKTINEIELRCENAVAPVCKALLSVPGIDGFKVEVPSPRNYGRAFLGRSGEERVGFIRFKTQYRLGQIHVKEVENAFVGRFGGYEWLSVE